MKQLSVVAAVLLLSVSPASLAQSVETSVGKVVFQELTVVEGNRVRLRMVLNDSGKPITHELGPFPGACQKSEPVEGALFAFSCKDRSATTGQPYILAIDDEEDPDVVEVLRVEASSVGLTEYKPVSAMNLPDAFKAAAVGASGAPAAGTYALDVKVTLGTPGPQGNQRVFGTKITIELVGSTWRDDTTFVAAGACERISVEGHPVAIECTADTGSTLWYTTWQAPEMVFYKGGFDGAKPVDGKEQARAKVPTKEPIALVIK